MKQEEIIARCEAEGMRYVGTVSRFTTPDEHAKVDLWSEQARAKNGSITQVIYKDAVHCFESLGKFDGPPTSRTHIKAKASNAA